jgi:hypothetical protein
MFDEPRSGIASSTGSANPAAPTLTGKPVNNRCTNVSADHLRWTEADDQLLASIAAGPPPPCGDEPPDDCSTSGFGLEPPHGDQRAAPAQWLAAAEAEPRPAVAAGLLDVIDPAELGPDGRVSLAQAWARVEAGAAAGKVAAVAAFAAPGESSGSEDFAELEIGAALRLGAGGAGRLVTVARQLAGKLPATLAALADGRIDYLRALRIAEATFGLDAAACAAVEARVLARAANQSAGQVGAAARRAAAAADPEALARRHRRAKADADVRLSHDDDGMGWITANLPSLDAQIVYAAVDAWARQRKVAGDPRTLGQLRGAALLEWSEAYLTGRPTAPGGEPWPETDGETCEGADAREPEGADIGASEAVAEQADAAGSHDHGNAGENSPGAGGGRECGLASRLSAGAVIAGSEWASWEAECASLPAEHAHAPGRPPAPPGVDSAASPPTASADAAGPPRRHGRPVTVNVTVDLPTFLGLADHPGEVQPGGLIPAEAIRELIPDAKLRRLIIDPMTGTLLDYGRRTYRVPADLAALVAARDATAATPGAARPAATGDLDHLVAYEHGGETSRDNLHAISRRWHRAKTIGGWQVARNDDGTVTWTSPLGRTYQCHPHDYRLGP